MYLLRQKILRQVINLFPENYLLKIVYSTSCTLEKLYKMTSLLAYEKLKKKPKEVIVTLSMLNLTLTIKLNCNIKLFPYKFSFCKTLLKILNIQKTFDIKESAHIKIAL